MDALNTVKFESWHYLYDHRREDMDRKLVKVNKALVKLGLPEVSIKEGVTLYQTISVERADRSLYSVWEEVEDETYRTKFAGKYVQVKVPYKPVVLHGYLPVIDGWKMVAKLEHHDGLNIIHKAGEQDALPAEYRTARPGCDHCGHDRLRLNTFVFQNVGADDPREWVQVGSTCLRDFFPGIDNPETIAKRCEGIWGFVRGIGDLDPDGLDEYMDREPRSPGHLGLPATEYLAASVLATEFSGFMKTGDAWEQGGISTRDFAYEISYYGGVPKFDRNGNHIGLEEPLTEAHYERAGEVAAWVQEQDSSSEFMQKAQDILTIDFVSKGSGGLVACLPHLYFKAQEKAQEEKQESTTPAVNEWAGEVGERKRFTATLISSREIESFYGTSTLHKFRSDGGNTLTWFNSGRENIVDEGEPGDVFTFMARIKKCDEYQGWKQTVLTRCTKLEKVDA